MLDKLNDHQIIKKDAIQLRDELLNEMATL
jgi:hypothetical protein